MSDGRDSRLSGWLPGLLHAALCVMTGLLFMQQLIIRYSTAILLSLVLTVYSVSAQAALPPVAPRVSCASMRAFDPKLPEAPTQVTDAREAQIDGKMEAQRHSGDFDGIAAGAPALNFLVQNSFYHAWNAQTVVPRGTGAVLLAKDRQVLHQAVLAACDTIDGVRDGIIADPPACRFDLATVECRTARQTGCLSHEAVATAAAIYGGARDPQGRNLVIGGPQPGSELAWAGARLFESAYQRECGFDGPDFVCRPKR